MRETTDAVRWVGLLWVSDGFTFVRVGRSYLCSSSSSWSAWISSNPKRSRREADTAAAASGSSISTDCANSADMMLASRFEPASNIEEMRFRRASRSVAVGESEGDERAGLVSTTGNEHALSMCVGMSRSLMYR